MDWNERNIVSGSSGVGDAKAVCGGVGFMIDLQAFSVQEWLSACFQAYLK